MSSHVKKTAPVQYIPALGFSWLTPVYDLFQHILTPEIRVKRRLIELAHIDPQARVLDIGSGTGTLTILVKQIYPQAQVTGLDIDAQALGIARAKAEARGVDVRWVNEAATRIPFAACSFERVLSSLMLHHLSYADKLTALRESWRVLVPGGEIYILDLGVPHSWVERLIGSAARRMEHADDNIRGLIPALMCSAGFYKIKELERYTMVFGALSLYRGRKPAFLPPAR